MRGRPDCEIEERCTLRLASGLTLSHWTLLSDSEKDHSVKVIKTCW